MCLGAPLGVSLLHASPPRARRVLTPRLPPCAPAPLRAQNACVLSQFVDVCILAGCDYCETIKGVAATTAYKEVKKHGSLEAFVAKADKEKLPEGVDYAEVRACVRACASE